MVTCAVYVVTAWKNPGFVVNYIQDSENPSNLSNFVKEIENHARSESAKFDKDHLRLDNITNIDNSTHIASSPDAKSPKKTLTFQESTDERSPNAGTMENGNSELEEIEEIEDGYLTDDRNKS
jgi:hypothetical protein